MSSAPTRRRLVTLRHAHRERFTLTRAWWGLARILDSDGTDVVRPWLTSRADARRIARELGITLKGAK